MRERIYSLEGQLVKAAIMITEARERAEAAEASLVESEEKSDQRLKMALEWKRSRDDYCERLDIAIARAEAAEATLVSNEIRALKAKP